MKDLNLEDGDTVYFGRVKGVCIGGDSSTIPYRIEFEEIKTMQRFTKDGRISEGFPPVLSRVPYDLPEMVYEEPIKEGEMVFAWDSENDIKSEIIDYGRYKGLSKKGIHVLGEDYLYYNFISKTSPIG